LYKGVEPFLSMTDKFLRLDKNKVQIVSGVSKIEFMSATPMWEVTVERM